MDRNNQAFAVSTRVYDLALDVRVLVGNYESDVQEQTISTLAGIEYLNLDYSTLKSYLAVDANGVPAADTHWKVLAKKLTREQKEEIEALNLKGVVFGADTKRSYPLGSVGADVIGFIRGDSSWGLERKYDSVLSGVNGREFKTYEGSASAVVKTIDAKDGSTIVTTLDYNIQQYAEQAVAKAVEDFDPKHAAVLVMNPKTGEVYAMADSQTFNSNDPSDPTLVNTSQEFREQWEAMTDEEQLEYLMTSWRNFSVMDTFEPGSIYKPMVVAAALDEGIITENDTFVCNGSKTVYDRDIGCWQLSGHGTETLEDVLANSCNVAMMDIGDKMGRTLFYKYQKAFGIGDKTGIDLPAEGGDDPECINLLYSENRIGPVELATMSFGQSFNCTALQALTAFSAVINGGNLMQPYVVSRIVEPNGEISYEKKPTIIRKVISEETSNTVKKYLRTVIDSGTGKKAKIEGYAIGGKTGTAQQAVRADEKYTVTFVGFLPADDPEIIAIAVLDRPSVYTEGSTSAAPMLKGLLEDIIKYLGIPKTEETTENTNQDDIKVVLDDLTQYSTNSAITYLTMKNLNYQVVGEGSVVTSSAPHAGTEVAEGSTIILYVTKGEDDDNMTLTPNVYGKSYDEAVKLITDAGLSAVVEGEEAGTVIRQNPRKDEYVKKGSDVTLVFETQETEVTENVIPEVTGENPDDGTVTQGISTRGPDVPVISNNSMPSTKRKTGKQIR
ncbi:stage V sporulation protein D [Clostridiales bacterium]|nr:stage V sporulation protein D [Clostridiales bacterium]